MWLISNKRNRTESWPSRVQDALNQLKTIQHSQTNAQTCCESLINALGPLKFEGDERKLEEFEILVKDAALDGQEFIRLGQQYAVKFSTIALVWCGALKIMIYYDDFRPLITASSTDEISPIYDVHTILCDILKSHPSHQEVMSVTCECIGLLSDSFFPLSREKFFKLNVCEILSTILQTHIQTGTVMAKCCMAISCMTVNHNVHVQNEFASNNICIRIVNVIQLHEFNDSNVTIYASSAICNLCSGNNTIKKLFMEAGACEALVSILSRLQNESTLNAIFNLSQIYGGDEEEEALNDLEDSIQKRFQKAGLIDLLRTIIKENKDTADSYICENILEHFGIQIPNTKWTCVIS
jgi:hypothetical protein